MALKPGVAAPLPDLTALFAALLRRLLRGRRSPAETPPRVSPAPPRRRPAAVAAPVASVTPAARPPLVAVAPAAVAARRRPQDVAARLRDRRSLRQAIVVNELLAKPLALRGRRDRPR